MKTPTKLPKGKCEECGGHLRKGACVECGAEA